MAMGVCMRYSHNREQAQDLMQDGFIKVFEKLGTLKNPEKIGAWIYQIMVNVCVDYCKTLRPVQLLDDTVVEAVSQPLDPFSMSEIVEAMQHLPSHQRIIFNLVEVEGYRCEEVAQRLGLSASGVRAALSRAKASLRETLMSDEL